MSKENKKKNFLSRRLAKMWWNTAISIGTLRFTTGGTTLNLSRQAGLPTTTVKALQSGKSLACTLTNSCATFSSACCISRLSKVLWTNKSRQQNTWELFVRTCRVWTSACRVRSLKTRQKFQSAWQTSNRTTGHTLATWRNRTISLGWTSTRLPSSALSSRLPSMTFCENSRKPRTISQ